MATAGSKPMRYEIRVAGRLTDDALGSLEGIDARVESSETVLVGDVVDRAALHGLLRRLQTLGVELVEVRRLPS